MSLSRGLATERPLLFGLLILVLVLFSYVASAIMAELVADDRTGYEVAEAVGRLAASLFFVYLLWKFDWLGPSGITQRGTLCGWVALLVALVYDLSTTMYGLFGSLEVFGVSDPLLSAAVAANALTTGLIEEIPFRGIMLYAFVRQWGDSRRGLTKAVLYSSLLFGASHLIHILLGRPLPQAILVSSAACLSGIVYAAFVLRWKTLWTVIVLHGVGNAMVATRVLETPGFSETIPALGLMTLLQLPLVVFGVALILGAPARPLVRDETGQVQQGE